MNGISPDGSYRGGGAGQPDASTGPDEAKETRKARMSALRLWRIVKRVTPEEFLWQESHYDHDSRHGRELLFLIANNEWVRATSEIVDVNQSDAIDTIIKIDVDLDQLTHEAFRKRWDRFWLPIIVLPPEVPADEQQSLGQRRPE